MSVSSTSTSTALTGLSGYDFSGVISAMMQNYDLPETQMQTQESTLQSQQSAWQAINTSLSALNDTITALQSADTWDATTATSSNTSAVTATGGSGAMAGNYTVNVTQTAKAENVVTKVMQNTNLSSNNWSFQIGVGTNPLQNVTISSQTPTLTDIVNAINSAQAGVTATLIQIDSNNDYRISITANQTGANNYVKFSDPNGAISNLGITLDSTTGQVAASDDFTGNLSAMTSAQGGITQDSQDASFTMNGISISSASNTVTSAIQGVTLNLLAGGSSTVSVAADSSVAQKAVQSFVDAYNSTQSLIASDLNYDTTTKTAGALFGDAQLEDIQSRLRQMMGSTFLNQTSPDNLLSTVGISTSSDNFGESAALTFDTSKFAQAYAANPQSVANLFSAPYNGVTPSNGLGGTAIQGLGNTLSAYLNPLIEYGGTLSEINTNYSNQISNLETQISDFQEQSTNYQNMLNAKFTNLETILSKLNSQGTWLTNQINSLPSYSSSSSSK
ncbi:flagellar capping protein [Desulfosporosinus acidiphilus SJ4]|uniref:Flagellar hook-associated protein 2 n=1 Tax=Desulfosporosinus acidiphilus (strain DSM 22704 / JCM 16185 / SJ4) TaxID=646529 RepID=I4DAA6_DESAJ|nr:flagellar filament capping protein FliD [Desulfosporosinus acidiphilus]AFM42730.1 flagellar capping protein [Desulfosporosinus acidiphilus SJ4]